MMPPTLPSILAASPGQAAKVADDQDAANGTGNTASAGLASMPLLPGVDPAAWAATAGQQMDGLVLPQIPQLFVTGQDGTAAGDGTPQMPMLQMPGMPMAGQLPLFVPLPFAPTAGTAGAAGEGQAWPMMATAATGAMAAAGAMFPAGMTTAVAAAAAAQAEATAAASRASKAAAPPTETGSRRRPMRKAATMAKAAWHSSDDDQTDEEAEWVRAKRARRGSAAAAAPAAAAPSGPSAAQLRRMAAQQQHAEVMEVAGVAARVVACVSAAFGEPVLPDSLAATAAAAADAVGASGTMARYRQAQRQQQQAEALALARAQLPTPGGYAQLLMQADDDADSAEETPAEVRVSRFGRTVRPSTQRAPLSAAALALEAARAAGAGGGGRPGRPQRAAAVAFDPSQLAAAFDGTGAPFGDDQELAGEPKVCVECGTRTTPLWRTINGLTYCNADGLRMKRKLGML